jgi:hypothetical protein
MTSLEKARLVLTFPETCQLLSVVRGRAYDHETKIKILPSAEYRHYLSIIKVFEVRLEGPFLITSKQKSTIQTILKA